MNAVVSIFNQAYRLTNTKEGLLMSGIALAVILVFLLCPWQLVAGITFILAYVMFAAFKIEWAILVLIVIAPITRLPGLIKYIDPVLYTILFITLTVWFCKKIAESSSDRWAFLKYKEFHIFVILFSICMAISFISSINTESSLRVMGLHLGGFAALYMFFDKFKDESFLKKAVGLYLVVSFAIALIAILQYCIMRFHIFLGLEKFVIPAVDRQSLFANDTGDVVHKGYRSVGTFFHSNNLGVYLASSGPIFVSLFFYSKSLLKKLLIGAMFISVFLAIYCSGSRGAFMNLVVAGVFLLAVYWRKLSKKVVMIGAIAFIVGLYVSLNHILPYFRLSDGVSFRDIIWQNTMQLVSEHPIVGHGMGTFSQEYFARFGFPSVEDLETILNEIVLTGGSEVLSGIHAHNLFLNYAFEMGVGATLLMFFFYIRYAGTFLRFLKKCGNDYGFHWMLAVGCMAAVVGQFVHNFFESSGFNFFPFSFSFVLLVATGITLMHRCMNAKDIVL